MPHAESPSPDFPPLHVNDGQLDPKDVAYLRPSRPDEPLEVLRERYSEDGYLYMKGVLPRPDVLSTRQKYFTHLAASNILLPGTDHVDGIFNSILPMSDFPALPTHREKWYTEDLCKHSALISFVSRQPAGLTAHKTTSAQLLRNNVPGQKAIGVHYDQIFLRHGGPDSVTAWVSIGDVAVDGEGLIYLEKGDEVGRQQEEDFGRRAREGGLSEEQRKDAFNVHMANTGLLDEGTGPAQYGQEKRRRWLVADHEAGDVVFHHAFSVHAIKVNHDTRGKIRTGTDIRFVDSASD